MIWEKCNDIVADWTPTNTLKPTHDDVTYIEPCKTWVYTFIKKMNLFLTLGYINFSWQKGTFVHYIGEG